MAGVPDKTQETTLGRTYAFGGLGLKSAFIISKILAEGSSQNSSGFSPGTLNGSSVLRRSWLSSLALNQPEVARAAARLQYSTDRRIDVAFIVGSYEWIDEGGKELVVSRTKGRESLDSEGWDWEVPDDDLLARAPDRSHTASERECHRSLAIAPKHHRSNIGNILY